MADETKVAVPVEDPPDPPLAELQQRDLPVPAVPVVVEGAVRTHALPNRSGPAFTVPTLVTQEQALAPDPKRARAMLVGTAAWNYRPKKGGNACPIPASVPIYITHAGEVWVDRTSSDGTLTIITEFYAD